jgi:hypothetical protein
MKLLVRILFSIFFAIAIGVHVYYVIHRDHEPLWWHAIYFITYGVCWWMIFSDHTHKARVYALMASFPFVTHIYYGMQHASAMDGSFWVCVLVCVLLPLGLLLIIKEII